MSPPAPIQSVSSPTVLTSAVPKAQDSPAPSVDPVVPVSGDFSAPPATSNEDNKQEKAQPEAAQSACAGTSGDATLVQVCLLVNAERGKHKLAPLKIDEKLSQMSQAFAQDMADKNYFSHVSPNGGTMEKRFATAGIPFSWAGENIAEGQPTPSQVVKAWINSPEHLANLLQPNYHKIGLGKVALIWVQDFSN